MDAYLLGGESNGVFDQNWLKIFNFQFMNVDLLGFFSAKEENQRLASIFLHYLFLRPIEAVNINLLSHINHSGQTWADFIVNLTK